MLKFESLELEGVPFFKQAKYDLSYQGISLILGLNKDSGGGGNAAGKSYLVSHIPEMVLSETVNQVRRDRLKRGTRRLHLSKGKTKYTIEEVISPSPKLRIYKNGVDMQLHGQVAAKEKIKSLLGYNREEINSFLYLNFRMPHPLISGDTAVRKSFFSKFFRLTASSHLRKIISAELSAANRGEGALSELKARKVTLLANIGQNTLEGLQARLTKTSERLEVLLEASAKRNRMALLKAAYDNSREMLVRMREDGIRTPDQLEESEKAADRHLRELTVNLGKWDLYDEWEASASRQKEKLKARRSELKSVLGEVPSDLEAWLKEQASELAKLREGLESTDAKILKAEAARKQAKSGVAETVDEIKKALAKIKALEEATDVCPTCGGAYDNKHAKKELAAITSRHRELEEEHERHLEVREAKRTLLESLVERYNQQVEKVETQEKLVKMARAILEHQPVDPPTVPKQSRESLEELQATLNKNRNRYQGGELAFRAQAEWKAVSEADRKVLTEEDPTAEISKLDQRLGETRAKLQELKGQITELNEVSERIEKTTKALAEREPLELLLKAFSKGGVDSLRIQALCSQLEDQANHYAFRLFPEDYKFKFDLDTQFDISVERTYGKRIEVSDVRKLSGAEGSSFSLLLLIVLLVFVPEAKRSSILILDEPESALSPQSMERFVAFLPVLNKIIPHIIVVTPKEPEVYLSLNPRIHTVVKSKGRSVIKEGIHT